MSKQSSEYDRGYLESIGRFVNILQIHSFLDSYHTSRSPLAASKEYNDGYISGCNYISSFLDKHRSVPRILYNTLSDEIEFRQRILGHTPKFKVDGQEVSKDDLHKTPINREKVHVDAIGRIHTNKTDYSGLPKLEPGTDGSRSNNPVFDAATGGVQKEGEKAILPNIHAVETIQKAPGEKPSDGLNIIKNYTTREDLTPVHIIPNGLNAIHPGENIQKAPGETPSEALNRAAGNSTTDGVEVNLCGNNWEVKKHIKTYTGTLNLKSKEHTFNLLFAICLIKFFNLFLNLKLVSIRDGKKEVTKVTLHDLIISQNPLKGKQ